MRIVTLLVAGLLMSCSVPVHAEYASYSDCLKRHPERTVDEMLKKTRYCLTLYKKPTLADLKPVKSYRDTPEWQQYEMDRFEAREEASREIEAINRDYKLRRSGVLP